MSNILSKNFTQDEFDRLNALICQLSGKDKAVSDISFLDDGHNYRAFIIKFEEEKWILKVLKNDSENKIENIVFGLELCKQRELSTPEVVYYESLPKTLRHPFIIETYIDGQTFHAAIENMDLSQKKSCFFDLGRFMAKMHGIKSSTFNKYIKQPVCWFDYKKYLIDRLNKHIGKINEKGGDIPDCIEDARSTALRLVECINFKAIIPSMVHRDITLNNIMIHQNQFAGVIDFEHACFFDPLWDFAKLHLTTFKKEPYSRDMVFEGYNSVINIKKECFYEERIYLYRILELVWALANSYEIDMEYGNLPYKRDLQNIVKEIGLN